ncbi:hypothetical protein ACWC09_12525 [Streptomyces sp. NPDC001617]
MSRAAGGRPAAPPNRLSPLVALGGEANGGVGGAVAAVAAGALDEFATALGEAARLISDQGSATR